MSQSANAEPIDFAGVADSLRSMTLDFTKQAEVSQLTIERGGVKIILESGILTLGQSVGGRTYSAVFSGKGRFELTPPNRAERYMLARHTQDSTAIWPFEEIALIFSDSTEFELKSELKFSELGKRKGEMRLLSGFIDFIQDEFEWSFPALILGDIVHPQLPGRFLARFNSPRGNMVFVYDPKEIEEIQLYKHARTGDGSYPDLVQSFHLPNQYSDTPVGNRFGKQGFN